MPPIESFFFKKALTKLEYVNLSANQRWCLLECLQIRVKIKKEKSIFLPQHKRQGIYQYFHRIHLQSNSHRYLVKCELCLLCGIQVHYEIEIVCCNILIAWTFSIIQIKKGVIWLLENESNLSKFFDEIKVYCRKEIRLVKRNLHFTA